MDHKTNFAVPLSTKGKEVIEIETFSFKPLSHKGTTKSAAIFIDLSNSDDENDNVTVLTSKPPNTPPRIGKRRKRIFEKGESSNAAANRTKSKPFTCEICTETKTSNDSFGIKGCSHSYCNQCVAMYVVSKLDDNVTVIGCPERDCVLGLLEVEDCREILPKQVFDRWGNALCEAVILATEKFYYCPFKDCSALLIMDDDGRGEVSVKESECPNCKRVFCAQCKVAWHAGIDCEEVQKLNKDERQKEDIMLMQLANTKKWRRCPNCKIFVEKYEGCPFISCR